MNYAKNAKYFQPFKWKPAAIVAVIGIALLLSESVIGGIAIIAVAALMVFLMIKSRPTDAELDAEAASQLTNMKARALKKLGIDEDEVKEIAPISFDGYAYENAAIKQGVDGKYRSNKYQAVMFFFSSSEVYCYRYDFSLVDSTQRESTDVYFYKDIVSVSTQTEGTECTVGKGKSSQFDYEYFKLTTTGGTYISCSLKNVDDAQRSINGMRSLIKSKKSA